MIERHRGSAASFHGREVPVDGSVHVWSFDVAVPALALGSSQADGVVDLEACRRAGVEVVRRRSGGGAVLLIPGRVVWVDVVLPAGHARWDADVGRATWWLGEAWAEVLSHLGVAGAEVHRGGMRSTRWSPLVCFAGLGPGEVVVAGDKLVGISQRRTRATVRFQCALALSDVTEQLVTLLAPAALAGLDRAELTGHGSLESLGVVTTPGVVLDVLEPVLAARLG